MAVPGRGGSSTAAGTVHAPGKRSLTDGFAPQVQAAAPTAPAQTRGEPGAPAASDTWPPASRGPQPTMLMLFGGWRPAGPAAENPSEVHAAAARGTATPAGQLPHASTLQRAFGRHDLSGVKAHVGADAAASARQMGARAYAAGDHVVLGDGTDLHTVAHEAAHVVQQRGGVQLKGGVSEAGDRYERQADEVADAVVKGESAEGLLDGMTGRDASHGAHARRGESVGSIGGAAGAANVVQRARTKDKKKKKPDVKGYPTMEGEDLEDGHIPFDPECFALIVERIIPALNDLGPDALKNDPRTKKPTGFMIGVARTRAGKFVGSTSGAAPEGVVQILRQFCTQVVRSNVPKDIANSFVDDHDEAKLVKKIGRYQIANDNETGGAAGFCAAFKMLYAHPELEFVGMAEVVYAPKHKPSPKIMSGDGEVLSYDHGDPAPSCATCRVAIFKLQERGRRHRAPKPKLGKQSNIPQLTEAEQLEWNKGRLIGYCKDILSIPDQLLALLKGLSNQQSKAVGNLLSSLAGELGKPLGAVAEFVHDDLAVRAEDEQLGKLLKSVSDDMNHVSRLLSMTVNEGTDEHRTGVEGLLRMYTLGLERLRAAALALADYVGTLFHEDEGSDGGTDDEDGSGTLGSLLPEDVDSQAQAAMSKWTSKPAPSEMAAIETIMIDPQNEHNLWIYDVDGVLWELDLKTGKLVKDQTSSPDDSSPSSDHEHGSSNHGPSVDVHALAQSLTTKLVSQVSFVDSIGVLPSYMQITNASDHGDNCLIYAIAGAAKIQVTPEQIENIRKTRGQLQGFLGTEAIATICAELGVTQAIVVIDTDDHEGGAQFAIEKVGDGPDPIYLVNSHNIHFGWAVVRPGFVVQPVDDVTIEFVKA